MERLNNRLKAWLWDSPVPGSFLPRAGLIVARYVYALLREFASGELTLRAMSLVYTTMLAIVPLLALSFAILRGLGIHREMEPLLQTMLAPLGPRSEELTATIIGFVDNVQGSTLAGVSLALLLWTAFSMAQKVENSLNFVWRVDRPRSLARRFSEYLSVMLVGPAVMSIAMGMLATIESNALVTRMSEIQPLGQLIVSVTELTPYVLVVSAFSFLYAFVPNATVKLPSALTGGLISGIIWVTCGDLFATFVAGTERTALIYSGFAIVILGMLWLYLSWLILLLGAQLTFYHQNPDYLSHSRHAPGLANEITERLAISIMLTLGRETGPTAWSAVGLAAGLGMPRHLLEPIISSLRKSELIVETTDEVLIPARDLRKISVAEILASVRSPAADAPVIRAERWDPTVRSVAEEVEAAVRDAARDRSLADLVDQDNGVLADDSE